MDFKFRTRSARGKKGSAEATPSKRKRETTKEPLKKQKRAVAEDVAHAEPATPSRNSARTSNRETPSRRSSRLSTKGDEIAPQATATPIRASRKTQDATKATPKSKTPSRASAAKTSPTRERTPKKAATPKAEPVAEKAPVESKEPNQEPELTPDEIVGRLIIQYTGKQFPGKCPLQVKNHLKQAGVQFLDRLTKDLPSLNTISSSDSVDSTDVPAQVAKPSLESSVQALQQKISALDDLIKRTREQLAEWERVEAEMTKGIADFQMANSRIDPISENKQKELADKLLVQAKLSETPPVSAQLDHMQNMLGKLLHHISALQENQRPNIEKVDRLVSELAAEAFKDVPDYNNDPKKLIEILTTT